MEEASIWFDLRARIAANPVSIHMVFLMPHFVEASGFEKCRIREIM